MREYIVGQAPDDYVAPKLFPEAGNYDLDNGLPDYVQRTMMELARANALYLTDLFNQPQPVRDVCGQVIFGQRHRPDAEGHYQLVSDPREIPEELRMYKVRVRSLDGKSLTWLSGRRVVGYKSRDGVTSGPQGETRRQVPILGDVVADAGAPEADLYLDQAWMLLKQKGKNCCRCPRAAAREKRWTVEEVKPAGLSATEPPTETAVDRQPRRARV